MYFKSSIESVGHTPLVELNRLNTKKNVKILAKIEGQNPGGSASVKDRIANYMIKRAEQSGKLTKDNIILEATSGNTGIALAWAGCQKGYKVTIVMPDTMSHERRQLLKIWGAEVVLTPGAQYMNGAIEAAKQLAARDDRYFMTDQFSNPANPQAHYETTGVEILNEFPYDRIDYFVVGIGTGGTLVGTSKRLKEKYPGIKVIGVEPASGDSIQGLRNLDEYVPPIMDMSLISERRFITSREAVETTRRLAMAEGVFAGLSAGAAVCQAVKLAQDIDRGNIVTILPDGGWKYLSLDYWNKKDE
jgi:[CysO sulfur-carrier protein]-thiocarboxylate-dependent cysteine synthase